MSDELVTRGKFPTPIDKMAVAKDWRATVGGMPDDDLSREAARLGREWREQSGDS